jgi:peptidoglycan DL-endopeptidase CwlO
MPPQCRRLPAHIWTVHPRPESVLRSSIKRIALVAALAVAVVTALSVTAASLSAPQAIEDKQAEAQAVLAQIQQIDAELEHVIDDYNLATDRLHALEQELQTARKHLGIARQSNRVAQKTLEERLVALYENGGDDNVLEVVLGASSLDDLLDRVDAAKRVSDQDSKIVDDIRKARAALLAEQKRIEQALAEQKQVVAERAAKKDEIESQLTQRQELYNSIKDQIADLEAQERARQEQLAAEAQRRLEASVNGAADGADPTQAPSGDASSDAAVAPPSDSSIATPPPSTSGGVVGVALQYLGTPYQWAGASPGGFDCSGFVQYAYAQIGVSLPHNAAAQYGYGSPVSRDQLAPGDLVFFNGLGHVGIYIGGNQFVHSPHTGDVVKISSLGDSWYASTYVGARRI